MYGTFLHVLFRPAQSHDVFLIPRLGKRDLDAVETVANLADFLSLCSDDLLVETLIDEDVLGTLVFLLGIYENKWSCDYIKQSCDYIRLVVM